MDGDNAADRLTKATRLSIRAVLVPAGADPAKALRANGILVPVAIPFVYANDSGAGGMIIGDGRTPNVTATLESTLSQKPDQAPPSAPTQPEAADHWDQAATAQPEPDAPPPRGTRQLAPIRKQQR